MDELLTVAGEKFLFWTKGTSLFAVFSPSVLIAYEKFNKNI
jgi:hypothetical protein